MAQEEDPLNAPPHDVWWNHTEWLAAIVDSSDDAIVGKTLDSVIRSWNTGAQRVFGYTAQEIIGKSIRLLIPPELQYEEDDIVAKLVRGDRLDHFESVRVRKDGTRIDVSISVSPIRDQSGAIVGAAKIARDTSEANRLRRAEAELTTQLQAQAIELEAQVEEAQSLQEDVEIANEQLEHALESAQNSQRLAEAANRAKSQFLTTMSHELRTPLNAIAGYVELLEMGLRGPVSTEQLADLDRIKRSQRTLLRLIEDLLDHAKLESGQVVFHIADVAIDPILQNLEAFIAPLLERKGVGYELVRCPTAVVRADPAKVEQILLNLLSNATKFTEKGRIEVRCAVLPQSVEISVLDSGRGIPKDMLEKIFDPFVQVESDLTRTAEGTGLGLSISRALARGMGGDVTAHREAVGSRLTFILPRALPVGE